MKRIRIQSALIAVAAGCLILVLAGCNQELNLGDYEFQCDEPSDCVAPYVCDLDAQRCVLEDAGGQDATDDTTDISDSSDTTDSIEPEDTGDTTDTSEADIADDDIGDTSDTQDTEDDAEDVDTSTCQTNDQCLSGRVCINESCVSPTCDSFDDCGPDEMCNLEGQCEPLPQTSSMTCTVDDECGPGLLCTERLQSPGACILWRCDYYGVRSNCPDNNYCARFRTSQTSDAEMDNLCSYPACETGEPNDCPNARHCVEQVEGYGRCETTGSISKNFACNLNMSSISCVAGTTCTELPWETDTKCRTVCNPFASNNPCAGNETCVTTEPAIGVCVPSTEIPNCDTSTRVGTACDQAKLCLADSSSMRSCDEVCRVGHSNVDCGSGLICNPTGVPGLVGYGVCESSCSSSTPCEVAGETCVINSGNTGFCATTCDTDIDCQFSRVCKQGHCD